MVDLSEAEREELARLRERFGDVDLEQPTVIDGTFGPIEPMLAETLERPLESVDESAWLAERKYDGTRLVVEKFDDEVRAYTRRGIDRYGDVPAVHGDLDRLPNDLVVDGELTFLDPEGTSRFHPIHSDSAALEGRDLTPVYVAFDLLYDGSDRCRLPLEERRERLAGVLAEGKHLRLSRARESGFSSFFEDLTGSGEEGIMLKRRASQYYPGVRSGQWRKVKRVTERDAIVVGYTEGEGHRAETFGSLVLSDGEGYIGRVGTGFSEADLTELAERMTPVDDRPVPEDRVGAAYTPVEPFVVTVTYQNVTENGKLRSPVFQRVNPEKPLEDVQPVE